MAVSYTNVNRPGANLQSGNNTQIGTSPSGTNPQALHIEEYGGQIEGTIARKSIVRNFIPVRSVTGTSILSNFRIGESTLAKVTPGTAPDGTVNQAAKVSLRIDTLINARSMVPLLDDFQNSYDARMAIGQEHGKKFAKFIDQAFLIQAVKAAQLSNSGLPAGWSGGTAKTFAAAGDENDPAKLEALFSDLFADMEGKDVDPISDDVVVVLKPAAYYTLLKNNRLVDRDFVLSDGTEIKTKSLSVYGVPVYVSNNLPTTNISGHELSNAGNSNAYDGDFTKVVAAAFSPKALLAGETIPLTPDVFYDPISKMWFIDAHTSFGVTPDNPAYAGVLLKA
ncbi:major head protein [Ralstonia phage RSB1]|uniref:Major capsid-like protein n=1 Tax=Ralstonia phage RSB1 TaxID=551790 RepID=B5BTW8_9CAUD|nr:major head protein [Ralstonia phage RSB1]BAG70390.1 major capsid-like protein [Ralstonia phage RSB1]